MNEHVFRKPAFFIHLFFSGPMIGVSAARDSNGNAVDVLLKMKPPGMGV
jgi:hypothetical protein